MYARKKCIICGEEFQPNSGRQKCCSENCLQAHQANNQDKRREQKRIADQRRRERKRITIPHRVIECEGYAERQKAKTIEMYARVKIEL